MQYSYNWLKEYIPNKLPEAKKLAEILNYFIGETTYKKHGSDFVLNIDIPVNRFADLGGHLGLAREIATCLDLNLNQKLIKIPQIKFVNAKNSYLNIQVDDPNDCPQYCGLLIQNVEVKPSPKEIQSKLLSCGLRSINNIVDITNLVMLEYNQPMHAFDYDRINIDQTADKRELNSINKHHSNSALIKIRRARAGEKITTLDGTPIELNENILVVANQYKPLAIAGIKGGEYAGITKNTKNIVLESANFNSSLIYKSSKYLNLSTDASCRFAHNLPQELTYVSLLKAAFLIKKYANGTIIEPAIRTNSKNNKPTIILLNLEKIYRFLGFNVDVKFLENILHKLEFQFVKRNPKLYLVSIPYWRLDLQNEDDLIGEIGRIFGFNNIPFIAPQITLSYPKDNEFYNFKQYLKTYSLGLGLSEIHEYNFIGAKEINILDKSILPNLVKIKNPQSSEYLYLRPFSLVSSLRAVSTNIKTFPTAQFFEISKNFLNKNNTVVESDCYSFAIYNSQNSVRVSDWLLKAKGILESLFSKFGISEHSYFTSNKLPNLLDKLYGIFADNNSNIIFYTNDNKYLASLIIPSNKILDIYDITIEYKKPIVILGEINLQELFKLVKQEIEFNPLPKYPSSIKDLSILVPQNTLIQDIYLAIQQSNANNLADIDIFDIYEGLDKGKSISFHLMFRSDDHTLTDQEIKNEFDKIVKNLKQKGWSIR